jgi:acetyl esterase
MATPGWPISPRKPSVVCSRDNQHLGRPPALIVTAEHNPLRDEGDAYATRLTAAGVRVQHRCEPKMIHGFLTLDTISPAAAEAGERLFADITQLLATPIR